MNTIGIIGKGFVGNAVFEGMKHAFKIIAWDKKDGFSTSQYLIPVSKIYKSIYYLVCQVDGPIFVCVPTPMQPSGCTDISIVESVVDNINKAAERLNKTQVVIIKSTVPPGTTTLINKKRKNLNVCFNPEFLREVSAIEDFKNQNRIIVGGPRAATNIAKQMYGKAYPDIPITKTSSEIAELVKYIINCFLATKVSFANEIKQICDGLNVDYDKVIEYATKDKRLGTSHWAIPGPMSASDDSGKLLPGFGGSCFPKDVNSLICVAEQLGINPRVMKAVWAKNLEVRPEKDWENMVGRAISEKKRIIK